MEFVCRNFCLVSVLTKACLVFDHCTCPDRNFGSQRKLDATWLKEPQVLEVPWIHDKQVFIYSEDHTGFTEEGKGHSASEELERDDWGFRPVNMMLLVFFRMQGPTPGKRSTVVPGGRGRAWGLGDKDKMTVYSSTLEGHRPFSKWWKAVSAYSVFSDFYKLWWGQMPMRN